MLVFRCWTMPAYFFYCTSKCSIPASNVHTPTSKWSISASKEHTPKRMVQESQKFFGCVRLCLSLTISRSMSHKSSDSCMGGPVQATRVINEKQLLQVMVGVKKIISFGKEYVKLAWKIHRQTRLEELGFLTFEKIWNDSKDKKILYILKSSVSWKVCSEK